MFKDLSTLRVGPLSSIQEAMAQMNINRLGIVLVVDEDARLLGTITDGDVRRAILANISIASPVSDLSEKKAGSNYAQPIVASVDADTATLLNTLRQHSIRHLPLVDHKQRVVDMVTLGDFLPEEDLKLGAVIMAGGAGSRLRPLTEDMPKPMLPVGGRPLLELIIEQLRDTGIKQVNLTVNYKSEKITDHFGDGSAFGVGIRYVAEDRPLGTAGALGLMEAPQETMLVINGDILTQIDFQAMLNYHREHLADLTVAVQQHDIQVPYGVVECDDVWVRQLVEKPVLTSLVNAGIYLLEPDVLRVIPAGKACDMTDIIGRLLSEQRPVAAFPIHEGWIDIGKKADYEQAQKFADNQRLHP